MKLRQTFLLIFLIIPSVVSARQQPAVDSLLRVLSLHKEDTAKVSVLHKLAQVYAERELMVALKYAYQGSALAGKLRYEKGVALFDRQLGRIYGLLNQNDSAMLYYDRSIAYAIRTGNRKDLAKTLNNKAIVYKARGQVAKAFELYQQVKEIGLALKSEELVITSLTNMTLLYKGQGKGKEALAVAHEGLARLNQLPASSGNQRHRSRIMINLGTIHGDMQNLDSALFYFTGAMKLKKQFNDQRGFGTLYHNMAKLYEDKGNHDYAMVHYRQAITLRYEMHDTVGYARSLSALGNLYCKLGNYKQAISYLQQALVHTKEEFLDNRHYVYSALANAYEKARNIEKAYTYRVLEMKLSDSLQRQNNDSTLMEMQTRYETKQREHLISTLQRENNLKQNIIEKDEIIKLFSFGFLGVLVAGIIGLSIAIYQIRNIKNLLQVQYQRVKESEEELNVINEVLQESNHSKQRLLSIIAHDLKTPFSLFSNTLQVARTSSEQMEKAELVRWLVEIESEFNAVLQLVNNMLLWAIHQQNQITFEPQDILLRQLLDNNMALVESLAQKKEIRLEKQYFFSEHCTFHTDLNMIQFVLRNLVTNAVKYTPPGGSVTLKAIQQPTGTIQFSVYDTGVGIAAEDLPKLFTLARGSHIKGTGLGLVMCREFVEMMNGTISIQSELGRGTCVTMCI